MPVDTVVVMGVSGCGKSTVGRALAERLDASFIEGDDLHSAANREKMRAGIPLTDEDRFPWLAAIREEMGRRAPSLVVVACSSLKRVYRDVLREGRRIAFVFLDVPRPLLERRLLSRPSHFFAPSLLSSQLATLEVPDDSEGAVVVHVEESTREEEIVDSIVGALAREGK